MEISDLKSAATLWTRYYTIQNISGISNEIGLQGVAKLPKVKVGGP